MSYVNAVPEFMSAAAGGGGVGGDAHFIGNGGTGGNGFSFASLTHKPGVGGKGGLLLGLDGAAGQPYS